MYFTLKIDIDNKNTIIKNGILGEGTLGKGQWDGRYGVGENRRWEV